MIYVLYIREISTPTKPSHSSVMKSGHSEALLSEPVNPLKIKHWLLRLRAAVHAGELSQLNAHSLADILKHRLCDETPPDLQVAYINGFTSVCRQPFINAAPVVKMLLHMFLNQQISLTPYVRATILHAITSVCHTKQLRCCLQQNVFSSSYHFSFHLTQL